jgi:hypothetical protein
MTITTNSYGTKFIDIDTLPRLSNRGVRIFNYPETTYLYITKDNGDVEEIAVKDWTRTRGGYCLTYGNGSQVQIYTSKATAIRTGISYLSFIKDIDSNTVPIANWHELKEAKEFIDKQ